MDAINIMGRPRRISWSQSKPVLVRNLPSSVDEKRLYDIFSVHDNFLFCIVMQSESGEPYAFVHFETDEAAQEAISKVDETLIDGVKVSVVKVVRRNDSESTVLCLKNFPLTWTEENFTALCAPFGKVERVYMKSNPDGVSKGFCFVKFEDHESAKKALAELHGMKVSDDQDLPLLVTRAQETAARVHEIQERMEAQKAEFIAKSRSMNLYVKNLAESVTDEQFKDAFKVHGIITSIRIMRDKDTNISRGFGYVCFSAAEEAMKALAKMNGSLLNDKPLYVAPYQREEDRNKQLFFPRFPFPARMIPPKPDCDPSSENVA